MKVCVDSGVTFFGLVEQDYEVPKRLLSVLGIKGASIKTARVKTAAVSTAPRLSAPSVKTACLHTSTCTAMPKTSFATNGAFDEKGRRTTFLCQKAYKSVSLLP